MNKLLHNRPTAWLAVNLSMLFFGGSLLMVAAYFVLQTVR